MGFMKRFAVAVTTDAGGDATGRTPTVSGTIRAIRYVPDGSTPLATGADIVVTAEQSGLPILTAANIGTAATQWQPRAATHAAGDASAALYAAAGQAVNDAIPVADEAVKIVVAQGGNVKSGTFHVYVEGA